MTRPITPATATIIRRAEPHLALVEIPSLGDADPVLAPGVVATPNCVAIAMRFVAGRQLAEVAAARIRFGERRWPACLTGLKREWDTCCFSPDGDDFAVPPVPVRWSHTLRPEERLVALTPLTEGGVHAVVGRTKVLEPCANAPYERSQMGIAHFVEGTEVGALLFDSEARLAGALIHIVDGSGGRLGAFVSAERLSGLPEVPLYMRLSTNGLDADALRNAASRPVRDPRSLAALATAARRVSDLPLALKALDLILRNDPDHAWAHFERAVVLQELGRAGESALALRRAATLDPERYSVLPMEAAP